VEIGGTTIQRVPPQVWHEDLADFYIGQLCDGPVYAQLEALRELQLHADFGQAIQNIWSFK
jgi:hypothetical protein